MDAIGCYSSSRTGLRRVAAGAALVAVLCLALHMRVYRISEETPHPDEITSMTGLYEKTFSGALEAERILDPPMTPVYLAVQYAWARTVGLSVLSMRLLSLIFSMATFVVVYRLGIRLNSRLAGLTAMALLAVSPIHIFYSIEIRNYSLTVLLGMLSLLTLLRGAEHPGGRIWALNFLVDLLLAMTHLFASLLFVAEALFLLLHHRRRPVLVPWVLSHAVISLVVGAWLATCDFRAIHSAADYLQSMNVANALEMAASMAGGPFNQYGMFLSDRFIAGIFIAVFLLAVLALAADGLFFRGCVADANRTSADPSPPKSHALSLVVLGFAVPPFLLAVMAQCYTPCFTPRYVLYSMPAALVVLACAVTMPRAKTVRILLAAGLVLLNVYQSGVLLDRHPLRPGGWGPICTFLHDEVRPDDYFMVLPPYASRFITGIEMLAPAAPRRTIHKETWLAQDLEELAAWHAQGIQVWLMNHLNEPLNAEQEASLAARGIPFRKTVFKDTGFAVYRIPIGEPAPKSAGAQ